MSSQLKRSKLNCPFNKLKKWLFRVIEVMKFNPSRQVGNRVRRKGAMFGGQGRAGQGDEPVIDPEIRSEHQHQNYNFR